MQSIVAKKAINAGTDEAAFYQGKIQATQYFIRWELPSIHQGADLLMALDDTCLNMEDDWF